MAGLGHQAGLVWHHCCQAHARRCCHVVLVCCRVHNDVLASCRVARGSVYPPRTTLQLSHLWAHVEQTWRRP